MRDPELFELRLRDAFRRYADEAPADVDAEALAASIAAARRWPRRLAGLAPGAATPARRRSALALLLVAAAVAVLVVAQLFVGGHRPPSRPFGPAGNGLIGFELDGDVYVGDPTTGTKRLVLGSPAVESGPVFSPDGARVALIQSTAVTGQDRVVVVGVDGTNPVVVTPTPLADLTELDWTPDGRQLALVARVGTHKALLLADAGAPGVRTIVDDVDVDSPVFRPPDGREILFRAATPEGFGIFVMNADGTNRRALISPAPSTNAEYTLRGPQYSPDGSEIAFMAWDDQQRDMRTWIVNADGSGTRPIAHDPRAWFEGWPIWSPDGRRLILIRQFVDAAGRPVDNGRPFAVAWVDGHAPPVETGPPLATGDEHAAWSPDGTAILVEGPSQELILNPAGGPWRSLPWATNTFPAWQRVAP